MSNVITALITIAVFLAGVAALAQSGFASADLLSQGWRDMESRYSEQLRTDFQVIDTSLSASTLDVSLLNNGSNTLRAFSDWDVVIEYDESGGARYQKRLTYTTSATPGPDEWTVEGIYLDASAPAAEVSQPGILDPGEEAVFRLNLSPAPDINGANRVVLGTPNGVSTSAAF